MLPASPRSFKSLRRLGLALAMSAGVFASGTASATSVVPTMTFSGNNADQCQSSSPGIGNFNQTLNPELACCMHGWMETGAGAPPNSNRLDCTETPAAAQLATAANGIPTFDDLYFYCQEVNGKKCSTWTGAKGKYKHLGTTAHDGVDRPFRAYVRDTSASRTPIPGFYDPASGQRCPFVPAITAIAELDAIDAAAMDGTMPAGIPKQCTRLVRTAVEIACPDDNGSGRTKLNTATNPPTIRCVAALSIKLHIAVTDLNNPTDPLIARTARRGSYHDVVSFPPTIATSSMAGIYVDFQKTDPVLYWKIQNAIHCPTCAQPARCGTGAPLNGSNTTELTWDTTQGRCFIKP